MEDVGSGTEEVGEDLQEQTGCLCLERSIRDYPDSWFYIAGFFLWLSGPRREISEVELEDGNETDPVISDCS